MKRRMEKVEKKVDELDTTKIIEQSRDEILPELREREARKDNLMFHQVKEPTTGSGMEREDQDIRKVIMILDFLQCPIPRDAIKFIFRAGERPDDRQGPWPIILSLKDTGARKNILNNTRRLASSMYKRISITPDLTPLQQKEEDGLRKEAEVRNNSMYKVEK